MLFVSALFNKLSTNGPQRPSVSLYIRILNQMTWLPLAKTLKLTKVKMLNTQTQLVSFFVTSFHVITRLNLFMRHPICFKLCERD